MNAKLLLILGVALSLLLLAVFWPGPVEPTPDGVSQLVEAGHFILEKQGIPILEESYTLEFQSAEGYLLNSQGKILTDGQTVLLAQQTRYDRQFLPIHYQLAADTPSGTQIISAQMGLRGLEMQVRVGLSVQSAKVVEGRNLALLDNNLIGQFATVLRAIRTEALDRTFTAAIPQVLLSLPARVDGPNRIPFTSGGVEYEGKEFVLHLGDTTIFLIEAEDRLVALLNPEQGIVGYDVDLFPDGVQVADKETPVGGAPEREMTFASGDLTLAGTLAWPDSGEAPYPAALFLHGSGPVDRDGNAVNLDTGSVAMRVDIYRQLAGALADAGTASLRFDKRGVGASQGDSALASRSDLLADARAAIDALRTQPEVDPERVILVGHSEGSYLAPVLAAADGRIAGVVLLAGAARPLDEITRWQVESLLVQQGVEGPALDAALAQQDQYIAFVKSSQGEWSDYSVADLRVQMPWLSEDTAVQLKATPLSLAWLREHYLATPGEALSQLQVPVLIISGEKDLQVPATEADLLRTALEAAGNDDVTVLVLPDLNHLLRNHPEAPSLLYRHLDEPVDPRVIEAIQTWITVRFES